MAKSSGTNAASDEQSAPITPNAFGTSLRELRKSRGKTLQQASSHTGISVPYLSDVERGNRLPFSLAQICTVVKYLGGGAEAIIALARAKAEQTGRVVIRPKSKCEVNVCVALSSAIHAGNLTDKDCSHIEEFITNVAAHALAVSGSEHQAAGAGQSATNSTHRGLRPSRGGGKGK